MSRDPAPALDILLAAEDARDFTASLDRDAFGASRLHQAAVSRCLKIMSAAAGRFSPGFRATHPAIPWRLMSDLRIHGFADVDLDTVWSMVTHHLPPLIKTLRAIVPPDDAAADEKR